MLCPNCSQEVEIKIEQNIFGEERKVIGCSHCQSIYTSIDKLHWNPVVTTNEPSESQQPYSSYA